MLSTPFTIGQNEAVAVTGTLNTTAGGYNGHDYVQLRNNMATALTSVGYGAPATGVQPVYEWHGGEPYACAMPVEVYQLNDHPNLPADYNLSIQHYTFTGKYNSGTATVTNAPLFTAMTSIDGGTPRVCDQVCGFLLNGCGDDRMYYKLVLPPKKGAVIQVVTTAPINNGYNWEFRLDGYNNVGGLICRMLDMSVGQPTSANARIVNNTDVPQTVHIVPNSASNELHWNFVIAVEP
jgi:hypothetical protein